MSSEQKKLLMKARVAVALQNELGRVTKDEEIEQVTRAHNYCKTTVEEPGTFTEASLHTVYWAYPSGILQ
jgi:hypothetical protein